MQQEGPFGTLVPLRQSEDDEPRDANKLSDSGDNDKKGAWSPEVCLRIDSDLSELDVRLNATYTA